MEELWRGFIFKLWSFSKKKEKSKMKINVLTKEEGLNDENLAIVAIVTSIRSLLKFNSNLLQIIIFFLFVYII